MILMLLLLLGAPNFHIPNQPHLEEQAENHKDNLSQLWFNTTYPDYRRPLTINLSNRGGGGTTFVNGVPIACRIGQPWESVLIHEVNHMVLHAHLGDSIPRWLDEGLCVLVEGNDEKVKIVNYLRENGFRYPLNELQSFKEYPSDVGSFYGQSYILCAYLTRKYGNQGIIQAYSNNTISVTDEEYQSWFRAGMPEPQAPG